MAQPAPLVKHPAFPSQTQATPQNSSATPTAPFIPRKEFIKDHRVTSSFSLLALSGSGLVRLYSFSAAVVAALRRLFDQKNLLTAVRERAPKHFFEFVLEGKPWSNAKSITSEKLIIDILAVILHHGYSFLSTIDYGREQDDRLAITFSRPIIPPSHTPFSLQNGSAISLNQPVRTPFAISFSSATLLRVVGPPLHSTPAVLQAVRGAWPRGVVSEKKVGDATFEFKLQGYKWFQEDTFATDSLNHILGLLTALDAHGFSLLTSLSLTNRSRVKDLWIFTGLAGDDHQGSQPSSPNMSNLELERKLTPQASLVPGPSPLSIGVERRSPPRQPTTAVNIAAPDNSPLRTSGTETASPPFSPPVQPSAKLQTALLRKPSPKTQIPVAFVPEYADDPFNPSVYPNGRALAPPAAKPAYTQDPATGQMVRSFSNPSSVGSCDMTGIGTGLRTSIDIQRTPDVLYATDGHRAGNGANEYNPFNGTFRRASQPPHAAFVMNLHEKRASLDSKTPSYSDRPSLRPSITRSSTLPLLSTGQSSSTSIPVVQVHAPSPIHATKVDHIAINGASPPGLAHEGRGAKGSHSPDAPSTPTPPLLTPGTFRDSAFSSTTGWQSHEIPIAWIGRDPEPGTERRGEQHTKSPQLHLGAVRPDLDRVSAGPLLPGAWASTPREDRNDVGYKTFPPTIKEHPSEEGDELTTTAIRTKHSGLQPSAMQSHSHKNNDPSSLAAKPRMEQERSKPVGAKRDTAMSGWVMVNVESSTPGQDKTGRTGGHRKAASQSPPPQRPAAHRRRSHSESRLSSPSPSATPVGNAPAAATMSAAAKTIAMIDAVDAREREQEKAANPTGLRRIFHRGKASNDVHGDDVPSGQKGRAAAEGGATKRRSPDRGGASRSR